MPRTRHLHERRRRTAATPRDRNLRRSVRDAHRHLSARQPGATRHLRRRAVKLLLDSGVLIGALDEHDAHPHSARALFTRWHHDQDAVAISAINLTEVLIAPSADAALLASARRAISALGSPFTSQTRRSPSRQHGSGIATP